MIHLFIEEGNTLAEDERFDGEEKSVDDARFHEHGIDLRATAYRNLFESSIFQFLQKLCGALVRRLCTFECFGF